ncbi:MAG TPA: hypothetical protein VGG06_01605 [Thermoanaerobaculia bacterium]
MAGRISATCSAGLSVSGLRSLALGVRLRHAVADGWARWRGRPVDERRLLAVAVAAEDAQRLHHLFRPETKILVAGAPAAEAPAER